ncbi:8-oxo-dGTP pyrophosphatase MutT (NUDIX family) [Salsuginibacillus halophilus]|uniref:8-oxo-dGTP pyrophosphatase MutT (NUDIX family) n=1 Tax=Salsuginibacillus halophilus TaxID=517424 RepID=A0A2P8HFU0_9BACI|nr:CoA pyrophosphatase [Salsuginibacillus halophilus]PSL45075.1 8-oxo-dGTP pyrophosphatase MutT (NUDIX family) [Salsuginibacillus halophilus]
MARNAKNELIEALNGRAPKILGEEEMTHSAVLLPLIVHEDQTMSLLFEVRSRQLNSQPGEICFPGGRLDPQDASLQETALRECEEETGIPASSVNIVAPLDQLVHPYTSMIHPFVGFVSVNQPWHPNEEVEELFTVPLQYFIEESPKVHQVKMQIEPEADFPYHLIPNGEKYNWHTRKVDEHFYDYNGYVIWGLTARIIVNFISVLNKTKTDSLK